MVNSCLRVEGIVLRRMNDGRLASTFPDRLVKLLQPEVRREIVRQALPMALGLEVAP